MKIIECDWTDKENKIAAGGINHVQTKSGV
jgi:hypothetical protein